MRTLVLLLVALLCLACTFESPVSDGLLGYEFMATVACEDGSATNMVGGAEIEAGSWSCMAGDVLSDPNTGSSGLAVDCWDRSCPSSATIIANCAPGYGITYSRTDFPGPEGSCSVTVACKERGL